MIILWGVVAILVVCFGFVVSRGAPYVPTHHKQLAAALDKLYKISDKDTLVDLGSGDGIVLQAAAERGASVVGYELNPLLLLFSYFRMKKFPRARVESRDFMRLDRLPDETTVVYAFTTGHSIEGIGEKLRQWSTGKELYFISYGFKLKNMSPVRSEGPMHLYLFKISLKG